MSLHDLMVEKVNGCARSSETRVNHPQKHHKKRQCLKCSLHIGVTTVHLPTWPSISVEALREPAAVPNMKESKATGKRKVRWRELIRSNAASSQTLSQQCRGICAPAMTSEGYLITLDK